MSKLLRLDGIGLTPAGADTSAKWNQLFLPGTFHRPDFPDGVIVIDGAFFARLVENWKREGARPLPVDYFHRGETGDDLPLEEKIAAGWINDLAVRPDGVWGLISWTDRARAYILADELRYLSPTFSVDGLNRSTGQSQGPTLFGAALLNDPYLKELPRVAASAAVPTTPNPNTTKEQNRMDPIQQMAAMLAALGIPPGTKHEDVISKCTAMAKQCSAQVPNSPVANDQVPSTQAANQIPNPNLKDGTAADKLDPGGDNGTTDPMIPMSRDGIKALELANRRVHELASRVEKLEAEKVEASIERLSDKLVADRRITPAQRDEVKQYAKAVGLSGAEAFFGKLPQLRIGEVGISGKTETPSHEEAEKAYYAEVERLQQTAKLSFTDACARVNATRKDLAKAITTLNSKPV